jgi:hypothetical protein
MSRLADGSIESESTTAQNLGMARSASFTSCSAADRDVVDGVGVVVVLVIGVAEEEVALGSFAVQADAAVITVRASAAAMQLLVFVIKGTPRDLTSRKAVCGVQAVNSKQNRCSYTSAFESAYLSCPQRSRRKTWVCWTPSPFLRLHPL